MASVKTTKPLYTKGEDDKIETFMKALIKKGKKLTADQKAELLALLPNRTWQSIEAHCRRGKHLKTLYNAVKVDCSSAAAIPTPAANVAAAAPVAKSPPK
jgi:hypothetical protein